MRIYLWKTLWILLSPPGFSGRVPSALRQGRLIFSPLHGVRRMVQYKQKIT